MKVTRAAAATAAFVLLLGLVHTVHMAHFKVDVVFYAAMADAAIAAFLGSLVLLLVRYFGPLNTLEKALLVVIWLLTGYGFAISVPTVIDRSLSFYILEKIQQRDGEVLQEKIRDIFIYEYMPEHRLVDVRLTEQLESGTIVIENGCVSLTEKGKAIATFGRFYRQNFLPKQRLLMGEYTDDLTDPFRNSSNNTSDYACK